MLLPKITLEQIAHIKQMESRLGRPNLTFEEIVAEIVAGKATVITGKRGGSNGGQKEAEILLD